MKHLGGVEELPSLKVLHVLLLDLSNTREKTGKKTAGVKNGKSTRPSARRTYGKHADAGKRN
jgi:hypothetical protein